MAETRHGRGERFSSGQSLTSRNRSVLPVKHVIQALNMTAAYLAEGQLAFEHDDDSSKPIPLLPLRLAMIFVKVASDAFTERPLRMALVKRICLPTYAE